MKEHAPERPPRQRARTASAPPSRLAQFIADSPVMAAHRARAEMVGTSPLMAARRQQSDVVQRVRFGGNGPFTDLGADKNVAALKMDTILAINAEIANPGAPFDRMVVTPRGGDQRVSATAVEAAYIRQCAIAFQKKIAENPVLASQFSGQTANARLSSKVVRKVNRVSGLLARKHPGMAAGATAAFNAYVLNGTLPPLPAPMLAGATPQELEFNRLVLAAYRHIFPGHDLSAAEARINAQWGTIEGQETRKVVAHRGDGATFDKLGDTLDRPAHNTLYNHVNENSAASTNKAMQSWLALATQLSGIECDVYLTQDDVPVVTHTSHVDALLAQENGVPKHAWPNTDIRNMLAAAVNPRFMALAGWLNLIEHYVNQKAMLIAQQRNLGGVVADRKLRIEIEMKQGGVMTTPLNPGGWRSTNKVVSAFLKNAPNSHMMEIAMFNNSGMPLVAAQAAAGKTMLAHVTHGRGGAPEPALREVRFGMHQRGLAAHINSGALDGKVVTFAPGLDHPGGAQANNQLEPVDRLPTGADITVEQSIQSARRQALINLIEQRRANTGLGPVSIHTLTDHGETGAATIMAIGLAVGRHAAQAVWSTAPLRAMHHDLTDAQIRQALNEAIVANDPAVIGRRLLQLQPALL